MLPLNRKIKVYHYKILNNTEKFKIIVKITQNE